MYFGVQIPSPALKNISLEQHGFWVNQMIKKMNKHLLIVEKAVMK
jgi:hypothetical protein